MKWMAVATLWLPLLAASPQSTQPDNTRTNSADRDAKAPTADQAKNNRSDRETMKLIRRAIVSDKSLSTYAHNVKIIADHGKVTLKGPVRSEEEQKAIESAAAKVVGPGNVDDQTIIKADTADKTKSDTTKE